MFTSEGKLPNFDPASPDVRSAQGDIWVGEHTVIKRFSSAEEFEIETRVLPWVNDRFPGIAPQIVAANAKQKLLELEHVGERWHSPGTAQVITALQLLKPLWFAADAQNYPQWLLGSDMVTLRLQLFSGQVIERLPDVPVLKDQAYQTMRENLNRIAGTSTGVTHLDACPGNICTDASGRTRLVDWSRSAYSYPLQDLAILLEGFGHEVAPDGSLSLDAEVQRVLDDLPFYRGNEVLLKRAMLAFDIKRGITGRNKPAYAKETLIGRVATFVGRLDAS